jgi:hypothetical protein
MTSPTITHLPEISDPQIAKSTLSSNALRKCEADHNLAGESVGINAL